MKKFLVKMACIFVVLITLGIPIVTTVAFTCNWLHGSIKVALAILTLSEAIFFSYCLFELFYDGEV